MSEDGEGRRSVQYLDFNVASSGPGYADPTSCPALESEIFKNLILTERPILRKWIEQSCYVAFWEVGTEQIPRLERANRGHLGTGVNFLGQCPEAPQLRLTEADFS